MKKLLSLLMVSLLVVMLAVPAFAEDEYILEGMYTFDLILDMPDKDIFFNGRFTSNGESFKSFRILSPHDRVEYAQTYYGEYYNTTNYWIADGYRDIVFDAPVVVDKVTYEWFMANTQVPMCDGSTCPATDLNADGICDDCGMTLSLRLVGYPSLPTVSGNNLNSVVLQREDGYFFMALTSDTAYSVSGSVGDNYLITVANEKEVDYVTYKCTDGKNWVHNSSGKAYSLSVGSPDATLLASTFDWTKDGEHFFPGPPTLAEVTEKALGEMTLTLGGTMMTLVVCGVGLIASLVVLSLFGKRSLIFRG